ncbi:chromosomal replication initiator protein DnaA [Candidatus Woesebacteria bacterium]|nr:chromosomal replication initiator protein DnaA [Candidatus Woesebacteria bacterium]
MQQPQQWIQVPNDEVTRVWQHACSFLQLELSPAVYNTWVLANPLTELSYSDADNSAQAIITSPTAFHSTNLKKNLDPTIRAALEKATQRSCFLSYRVGDPYLTHPQANHATHRQQAAFQPIKNSITPQYQQTQTHSVQQSSSFGAFGKNHGQSPRVEDLFSDNTVASITVDRVAAMVRKIGLRADYTFETFAVSTTNEMAHAAATAVSNRPGDSYNPLFLYGGVGVGKTHLMHAIAHNILQNNTDAKIIYCTGEEFTNEIVDAIRNKRANAFKSKYRTATVLLIDDVQFLAGKNAVQEEFFHTFNALTKQQSQVVLTSDRPPHEINLLEDRLRSRFEAGLMIDIQQPTFELRTAILLVKSKAQMLDIPIELAKTIAAKVESARKIEGIITSIRSEVELKRRTISPELIEEILKTEIESKRPAIKASPSDIIRTVANHYKVKQAAVKGTRRVKDLVTARHIAMYLLKEELSLPLAEIGKWFSGRDHTTVLHAVRKIEKDLKFDDRTRQDVSALKTTLVASY